MYYIIAFWIVFLELFPQTTHISTYFECDDLPGSPSYTKTRKYQTYPVTISSIPVRHGTTCFVSATSSESKQHHLQRRQFASACRRHISLRERPIFFG